jgi:hypothetical protein
MYFRRGGGTPGTELASINEKYHYRGYKGTSDC